MLLLSNSVVSTGQMIVSLLLPVLFNGTTISVIATDKHPRIKNDTTMAKNPITPITTRCGIIEPETFTI